MTEHLPEARESAQRTYDRRRARSAADTLALIPPNRWDDHTRLVIATLAMISAPSRIDDALDAFDGEPAHHLVEITGDAYDRAAVAEAADRNAAEASRKVDGLFTAFHVGHWPGEPCTADCAR